MAYDTLPSPERVQRTVEAVHGRGIRAELVQTKEDALERVKALIPPGCVVMTGASVTLQQIGFEEILISGDHPWRNFKADLLAEKDPVKQSAMRRQGTLAEYFLGSVNALAETLEGQQTGPARELTRWASNLLYQALGSCGEQAHLSGTLSVVSYQLPIAAQLTTDS